MKVGIVTTWNERCGLCLYSENIVKNLPQVDWRPIGCDEWGSAFSNLPELAKTVDLMHIMHQGGLMASLSPEIVADCGKTVITRHCIGNEAVFSAATVKTCHIRRDRYKWIPHGIPVVPGWESWAPAWPLSIGCCGIPFSGKGHMEAVEIAETTGLGINLVIPENPHVSIILADDIRQYCATHNIPCTITTDWLPEADVSRILSKSIVNVFFYSRQANGTSGAVRLGLAAGRPVIVSQHDQFSDIIETGYVTVANSKSEASIIIREYVQNKRNLPSPGPLLEMLSYSKTAAMYYQLYQEIL